MIGGYRGHVIGEKTLHGIKNIQFVQDEENKEILKSDISTKSHLNSKPMKRDPYEATVVDVKTSKIEKAGEGVFLTSE